MELMFQPLEKYAVFHGRARRSEYWLFQVFKYGLVLVLLIMAALMGPISEDGLGLGGPDEPLLGLFFLLTFLALLPPSLAVAVRRLHDIGQSGWWLLIGLVPVLGGIALLVFFLLDGVRGPNAYGPDPKAAVGLDGLFA